LLPVMPAGRALVIGATPDDGTISRRASASRVHPKSKYLASVPWDRLPSLALDSGILPE